MIREKIKIVDNSFQSSFLHQFGFAVQCDTEEKLKLCDSLLHGEAIDGFSLELDTKPRKSRSNKKKSLKSIDAMNKKSASNINDGQATAKLIHEDASLPQCEHKYPYVIDILINGVQLQNIDDEDLEFLSDIHDRIACANVYANQETIQEDVDDKFQNQNKGDTSVYLVINVFYFDEVISKERQDSLMAEINKAEQKRTNKRKATENGHQRTMGRKSATFIVVLNIILSVVCIVLAVICFINQLYKYMAMMFAFVIVFLILAFKCFKSPGERKHR